MTTDSPAARILRETRLRTIQADTIRTASLRSNMLWGWLSRDGSPPPGSRHRIVSSWTARDGTDPAEAAFSASYYPTDQEWPDRIFKCRRKDLEDLPAFLRGHAKALHEAWASGLTEPGVEAMRFRSMRRVFAVDEVTDKGTPVNVAVIHWTCDEAGDRSKDGFSLQLQTKETEFRLPATGMLSAGALTDGRMRVPGWLVQLAEDCRTDLLAWVPAQT